MKILLSRFVLFCFTSFGQSSRMEIVRIPAGPQMNTDRPAYSVSAQTVRKGVFQIEAGLQLNNEADGHPSINFLQAPTAQFRIGLSDHIELRIQNGINFRRGIIKSRLKASVENFEMGLKFGLLKRKKTNMSMVFQGILPTASGELSTLEAGGRFIVSVDHSIKESGTIGYNFGSKLSSVDENDPTFQAYYSVFYQHQMNSKLSIFAEAYHLFPDLEEFDAATMQLNIDFGLTYALKQNIQLDYSFGLGLFHQMNFHSVGISYRFAPDPKPRIHH